MRHAWLLSFFLICLSCSKPLPELTNIDLTTWKNDPKACKGTRAQFLDPLQQQREKLKGLSEVDLVALLGKPDLNDLSKRHEKFYYFYIDRSPACGGDSSAMRLIVRFNAVGLSREVAIERMRGE
jgi:hypothetical protein